MGLYTGVPDIVIPIFTLKDQGISVPITLSYHAGGIKVDEVASCVGLGWALNAGGVITREVRGRADKITSNGQLTPQRSSIDFYRGTTYSQQQSYIQTLQPIVNGLRDTEPDEFTFNFLGRSGKFYLDIEGEAKLQSHEGMKVKLEHDGSGDGRFKITAEDGTVYTFASKESSTFVDGNQSAVTSWYLTEIASPTGGVVSFEYSQVSASIQGRLATECVVNVSTTAPTIQASNQLATVSTATQLVVKKITAGSGTVQFYFSALPRLDVSNVSYPLDNIVVSDSNDKQLTRFQLTTGYFVANTNRQYTGTYPTSAPYLNRRLRLEAVQQFDDQNIASLPPYEITYLGDDDPVTPDAYTLPHRLSAAQDHWGFYNNKQNGHLFPGNPEKREIPVDRSYLKFLDDPYMTGIFTAIGNAANREVDTASVKAGLIETLKYPLGGYTVFRFESNNFSWLTTEYGCGVRIAEIAHFSPEGQLAKRIKYQYNQGYLNRHPKDYYYRYYYVNYLPNGAPAVPEVLAAFGLSSNPSSLAPYNKYVKIRALPQVLLQGASEINYGSVTVETPGTGKEVNDYATANSYPDYFSGETGTLDGIDIGALSELFYSQYTSSVYYPSDPLGSNNQYPSSISIGDFPYPPLYSNQWKRGMLISQLVYNEDNILIRKTENSYSRTLLTAQVGWRVAAIGSQGVEFLTAKYYLPNGWAYLDRQKITEYDTNGQAPLVTESQYFRDNSLHAQVTRSRTLKSDGTAEVTSTAYPHDYADNSGPIKEMKDRLLKAYPVEQVTYKESGSMRTIISGSINTYKEGGAGLIARVLTLEIPVPIDLSSFRFSNRSAAGQMPPTGGISNFSPDTRYQPLLSYDEYDSKGNPLQMTERSSSPVSYLWGYNQGKLIAMSRNAGRYDIAYVGFEAPDQNLSLVNIGTVEDVSAPMGRRVGTMVGAESPRITKYGLTPGKSYILTYWIKSGSVMPSFDGGTITAAELVRTKGPWQCFRHRVSNVTSLVLKVTSGTTVIDDIRLHPIDAQLDTYTYDPLVGLTSHTDSSGNVMYYEYDGFGRLTVIRDLDGNVVKSYHYNLKTN